VKIAILTLGTRGDVQPYAVLGQALKERGHDVVLSTAGNFESLIKSYGLDFVPVEADFQALLVSEEGKKIRKNPFLAKKQLSKFVYPMMADAFAKFYDLAGRSDKVLFHVKTMADVFADQFPGKMIQANVIPASEPTNEFSNPVFSALPLPSFLNKLTFKLTELGLKMWTKPVNDFRKNAGLPPNYSRPQLPSLYGISELFLKKPADFPENSHFTGFWQSASNTELSRDITEYIKGGDPPLLITFGSMPFETKLNLVESVKSASTHLNTRIILIKGWGLTDTEELNNDPNIKVIESAPYDKLFPFVKAVVHHGGIGTIAACLQAGKPFLTCPVLYPLGDQYFWGAIAYRKAVGLKPVALKKMNPGKWIESIRELLNNRDIYKNAESMAKELAKENGIDKAAEIIETYHRREF
jgi:sterol 3beta-glucosyltransferase